MTTLDETQARQVLGVAAEAGIPEIHAAYDALLDEARRAMGRDEAAMAAKLDTAREAFVFLRDLHAAAHISRPGAPRRAEKPGTSSACREPGERRGVETGEATLPSATDPISTVANQRTSPADLIDIPVRFASFLAQDDRYTGKGRIQVSNRMLVVTARRRTLFAWRRRSESFPVAGIRNVSRAGRQVRFATATTRNPWHAVLVCPDEASALALVQALPEANDTTLFGAHDVQRDLQQRLEAVSGPTVVVWALLAINLLAFLLVGSGGAGWITASPERLVAFGGNFSPLTTEGQWWRLLTCTFLHGGLVHLAFNLFALHAFGRLAERLYGAGLFAAAYLAAGVAGSAVSLLINPTVVSIGASGAIFGVMGLLVAFVARDRSFLPASSRRQLFINWGIFAAYALSQGLGQQGIDNAAHFGGLLAGLAIGLIIGTPVRLDPDSAARTGRRALAAIAATLLVAGAAAGAAPRLGPDYRAHRALLEAMQSIGAHEQRLAEEGKRLGDQQKAGALSRDDGIVILERMLDAYRPIDTRLHDIRPRPAALKDRQALLVQFVALRQEGIALLIEAERQQDEALAERGKERLNAGNALVAEMLKPFSWHD